jgi:toxin ParE1/3/4
MVKAVVWSPQALADLESVYSFIARDSPYHARKFVERIVRLVESVPQFPEMGRIVPEKSDPNIRERLHGSYRIVYRIKPTIIEIVMIHHSAMLFPEDV